MPRSSIRDVICPYVECQVHARNLYWLFISTDDGRDSPLADSGESSKPGSSDEESESESKGVSEVLKGDSGLFFLEICLSPPFSKNSES